MTREVIVINLSELSDEEFEDYRVGVEVERKRRDDLQRIPHDMRALADAYTESGGNRADLIQVLTDTPDPE
ncbi:hypothetical protein HMPREF0290_0862 [Corynebacterium efficiens YS-314]|nr:hypothetical protein HMPREF0290_0862 [Corynebacterium efficiens YS-314]